MPFTVTVCKLEPVVKQLGLQCIDLTVKLTPTRNYKTTVHTPTSNHVTSAGLDMAGVPLNSMALLADVINFTAVLDRAALPFLR